MFQAWLVQRVVREVLPLVVDTVRAQLRSRQAAASEPAPAAPAINAETEARFDALQDDLRRLERSLGNAREDFGRDLSRLLLWIRILAAGMVVLFTAILYLLFSR